MPQRCLACTHPNRDKLNKELLDARTSLAEIAGRYGMSKSALDRHKANHLKVSTALVSEARNALTVIGFAQDLYQRACGVLERAEQLLAGEEAGARGVQAAAASLREVRGSIELLAKLVVTTPDAPPENANSWLDQALTEAVAALRPPELPTGARQLETGIADAVIVQAPE